MESEETPKLKRLHFAAVLFLSYLIFTAGMVIEQSMTWTNHFEGFMSGLFHGAIFGLFFCLIYMLPWSLIIFGIYRWKKLQRFRTQWMLGPSLLFALLIVGSLVIDPPTPSRRFKNFTKTEFPSNAKNVHYHFSGGGIADYGDTYYFETTPAEVDRLIKELGLEIDEYYGREDLSHTIIKQLPGCQDFKLWKNAKKFSGSDGKQHWFYSLITDESRTRVYMDVGCT